MSERIWTIRWRAATLPDAKQIKKFLRRLKRTIKKDQADDVRQTVTLKPGQWSL